MIAFFAIVVGIVLFDQITKYLAVAFLKGNDAAVVIKGVLQFDYIENRGAAFGMLSNHRWVFLLISTVAIVATIIYMFKKRPESKLANVAVAFIVGGGIGNMVDRVFLGYVVDFIDFCAFPKIWRYTFNVADTFVCVGAGLLILYLILDMVKSYKSEKNKSEIAETENTKDQIVSPEKSENADIDDAEDKIKDENDGTADE